MDIKKKARIISPNIHIVAYSTLSDVNIIERVTHAGANNFIVKPFIFDSNWF